MSKTYMSEKNCDGCGKKISHKKKRYINELTSTDVMIRLNNFYGHEKVKLGDLICLICKKICKKIWSWQKHLQRGLQKTWHQAGVQERKASCFLKVELADTEDEGSREGKGKYKPGLSDEVQLIGLCEVHDYPSQEHD